MKANESPKSKFVYPNKLYARTNDNITLDISYAPQTLDAIEYTRTDAFIEKALKWIEENICEYCEGENIIFTANNTQYIDILNQQQFIEDFEKYMKE